jgi:hypothetical protein
MGVTDRKTLQALVLGKQVIGTYITAFICMHSEVSCLASICLHEKYAECSSYKAVS